MELKQLLYLFVLLNVISFNLESSGGSSGTAVVAAPVRAGGFGILPGHLIEKITTFLTKKDNGSLAQANKVLHKTVSWVLQQAYYIRGSKHQVFRTPQANRKIMHVANVGDGQFVYSNSEGALYFLDTTAPAGSEIRATAKTASPNGQRPVGLLFDEKSREIILVEGNSVIFFNTESLAGRSRPRVFNYDHEISCIETLQSTSGSAHYCIGFKDWNNDLIIDSSGAIVSIVSGLLHTTQVIQHPTKNIVAISYSGSSAVRVGTAQAGKFKITREIKTIYRGPRLLFLPDGTLVTYSRGLNMEFWNSETGSKLPIKSYQLPYNVTLHSWLSRSDGSILIGCNDGKIRLLTVTATAEAGRVQSCEEIVGRFKKPVRSVQLLDNGRVVACGAGGGVRIYNTTDFVKQLREKRKLEEMSSALGVVLTTKLTPAIKQRRSRKNPTVPGAINATASAVAVVAVAAVPVVAAFVATAALRFRQGAEVRF